MRRAGRERWSAQDGALNPVMVKELRQFARSRVLIFTVLALLGGLLVAVGGFAAAQGAKLALGAGAAATGGNLFGILMGILFYGALLVVPTYCAVRLSAERSPGGLDLLFTTSLRPGEIVRGKLYAAAVMALLVYSVALPFLLLTWLLRGIDLPTIVVTTAGAWFLTLCAAQFGIFFGALPISRAMKIVLFGLFGLQALMAMPAMIFAMIAAAAYGGSPRPAVDLASAEFWKMAGLIGGAGLAGLFLLYAASVALLMPPAANRARPVRATLAAIWAVSGAVALIATAAASDSSRLIPWVVFSFLFCAGILLMAISERGTLGPRIRREIPRARWRRLLARVFYSGPVGGLLWALLVGVLTFGVARACVARWPNSELEGAIEMLSIALLYLWGYAMAAVALWRGLLGRHVPYRLTWLVAVGGILLGAAIAAVSAVLRETQGLGPGSLQLFNIFALGNSSQRHLHFLAALIFAAISSLLNLRWLFAQWREFRPLDPSTDAAEFLPAVLPPLGPAPVIAAPEPPPLPPPKPAGVAAAAEGRSEVVPPPSASGAPSGPPPTPPTPPADELRLP